MAVKNKNAAGLMKVLTPELEKLAHNAPQYGEIILRAKITDYQAGTISLGIESARRLEPKIGGHSETPR